MAHKTNNFLQLSTDECLEVHTVVLANAERHYKVGQLLAKENDFGNAISHLILGTEEHIKAMILFLDSKGFELRKVEGVHKLFYMHVPRHNLLKEIFSVWLVLKPHLDKEFKRGEIKQSKKNKVLQFLESSVTFLDFLQGGLLGFVNYQWWKRADELKQNGFYVDYKDGIISPNTLDKEDFDMAIYNVNSVKVDLNQLKEFVESLNVNELKEFKIMFEESELRRVIKESIKRKP